MNQQSQVCESVGAAIGMFPLPENENTYNFTDLEKELFVSVEFAETRVGTWVWSCQAIVGDLTERSLSPMILLQLNDSGLTWCYYAVYRYAGGYSLNLKYAFCTPTGDTAFAEKALIGVLVNMRKSTLETRPKL